LPAHRDDDRSGGHDEQDRGGRRDGEKPLSARLASDGPGSLLAHGHLRSTHARCPFVPALYTYAIGDDVGPWAAWLSGAGSRTSGDPGNALARLVASSWQIVHQFRNILLAAQRELPAERIRGVHDRILRRVRSLIDQGQRAGTFRRDLPQQWLVTTAYSLMHAAAEDAAGRLDADDAAGLITATLFAAFTPQVGE